MIKRLEHLTSEEKLRARTVQPGEEEPLGEPYECVKISDGNWMRKWLSDTHLQDKRKWAQK